MSFSFGNHSARKLPFVKMGNNENSTGGQGQDCRAGIFFRIFAAGQNRDRRVVRACLVMYFAVMAQNDCIFCWYSYGKARLVLSSHTFRTL